MPLDQMPNATKVQLRHYFFLFFPHLRYKQNGTVSQVF